VLQDRVQLVLIRKPRQDKGDAVRVEGGPVHLVSVPERSGRIFP
jgi:hypothetical protein